MPKKNRKRSQAKPSAKTAVAVAGTPAKIRSFLSQWRELIFFLGYAAGLLILVLPGLDRGFDLGHDAAYLMSSIRIWDGQVPFRDFYPWYGPLFHYLLALFTGPLGNNLYAVKFYFEIIVPILSMGILILILRKLELAWSSRWFILAGSIILGLERIYYCGSIRTMLPVLSVALWYHALAKGQTRVFLTMFPTAFLLYFFSPDVGSYTMLTAAAFVFLTIIAWNRQAGKMEFLIWSGAGLLPSLAVFALLYFKTGWLKNYLEYAGVLSNNLAWSHGLSMPTPFSSWKALIYYFQPLIHLAAIGFVLGFRFRKRVWHPRSFLIAILTVLGVLMSWRTFTKAHPPYVQFGFLPALIICGLVWSPPLRPLRFWKSVAQALVAVMVLYGGKYIRFPVPSTGPVWTPEKLLGVRMTPEENRSYHEIVDFYQQHRGQGEFEFPLKSLYYAYVGETPNLPLDDVHYIFYPKYRRLLLEALEKRSAKYLVINEEDNFWDYPGENLDALFDYIDSRYRPVKLARPIRIYERRERPVAITELAAVYPGPEELTAGNGFTMTLKVPPDPRIKYIEFTEEFQYRFDGERFFSMPIIQAWFEGRKWRYDREESGRQRINPGPGKHRQRLYLLYAAREVEFRITFPGLLNFPPSKVTVENFEYRRFIIPDYIPRNRRYLLEKPP